MVIACRLAPTAAVFLAALARETTELKLIPTVVCLPLHDPVRSVRGPRHGGLLSHGRLEIGVGKGITPFEHLQFGHDPEEASARAADILAMLVRAWETGIMSSEGSAFYDFLELKLPWALQQKPHPPLWTAGNLEAAGARGHNFVAPFTITEAVAAATTSCGQPVAWNRVTTTRTLRSPRSRNAKASSSEPRTKRPRLRHAGSGAAMRSSSCEHTAQCRRICRPASQTRPIRILRRRSYSETPLRQVLWCAAMSSAFVTTTSREPGKASRTTSSQCFPSAR